MPQLFTRMPSPTSFFSNPAACSRFSSPAIRLVMAILLAISMLAITGCSGCGSKPAKTAAEKKKEEEEKEKKKKKPDFQNRQPVVMPAVFPVATDEKINPDETDEENKNRIEQAIREARKRNRVKPGHWATSYFQVIANNFDAQGEIETGSVNSVGAPVDVEQTRYFVISTRPASMPKGQWRNLETSVYLPRRDMQTSSVTIRYDLQAKSGLTMTSTNQGTSIMKPHQYHFVVLTHRPDFYQYINLMQVVTINDEDSFGDAFPPFYYVVPSRDGDPVPLPRHALNWSTIAYILWDDYAGNEIETDQQTAMIDWLHSGGQIIVSGPDSLDKIQNSFLADHLPATYGAAGKITKQDFETLNENWSVKETGEGTGRLLITADKPLLGIEFNPHPDAVEVDGTGGLVLERRIGRGRVVVTAFSLEAKQVIGWPSYESFFNGALMRRPARRFGTTRDTTLTHGWVDDQSSLFDPLIGSTVRYLSRDLSNSGTPRELHFDRVEQENTGWNGGWGYSSYVDMSLPEQFRLTQSSSMQRNQDDVWHYGGYTDTAGSGVGGWSDSSGISNAARATLKQAAGISPPPASFVLKMLAAYLLVLVPLNWVVFRLMGRVEWAWIAAPLIAITGALMVVKLASLDIGFVRSNTQISLLEVHADYPRAHLSDYSALYTSLSTRYNVELENLSAQSLPFASSLAESSSDKASQRVTLNRTRANRLEGFQIQSNSTGMLHTESMIDLGGPFSLVVDDSASGKFSVQNATQFDVQEAGVVYRKPDGTYQSAWLGIVPAGTVSAPLEFAPVASAERGSLWREHDLYRSDRRIVQQIWNEMDGDDSNVDGTDPNSRAPYLEILKIRSHKAIEPVWSLFKTMAIRELPDLDMNNDEQSLTFDQFFNLYQKSNTREETNLGAMFDAVNDHLELEKGEMRMIGSTGKPLGETRYDPESTRVVQQTLVVVHLKKGELPAARRDQNTIADAKKRSRNLDDYEESTSGN